MENSELHHRIFERLGNIEARLEEVYLEAKKTNGRVTRIEGKNTSLDKRLMLLERSQIDDGKSRDLRRMIWMNIARGVSGVVWVIVAGLVMIVLQKTGILNISIVDAQTYAEVEAQTE